MWAAATASDRGSPIRGAERWAAPGEPPPAAPLNRLRLSPPGQPRGAGLPDSGSSDCETTPVESSSPSLPPSPELPTARSAAARDRRRQVVHSASPALSLDGSTVTSPNPPEPWAASQCSLDAYYEHRHRLLDEHPHPSVAMDTGIHEEHIAPPTLTNPDTSQGNVSILSQTSTARRFSVPADPSQMGAGSAIFTDPTYRPGQYLLEKLVAVSQLEIVFEPWDEDSTADLLATPTAAPPAPLPEPPGRRHARSGPSALVAPPAPASLAPTVLADDYRGSPSRREPSVPPLCPVLCLSAPDDAALPTLPSPHVSPIFPVPTAAAAAAAVTTATPASLPDTAPRSRRPSRPAHRDQDPVARDWRLHAAPCAAAMEGLRSPAEQLRRWRASSPASLAPRAQHGAAATASHSARVHHTVRTSTSGTQWQAAAAAVDDSTSTLNSLLHLGFSNYQAGGTTWGMAGSPNLQPAASATRPTSDPPSLRSDPTVPSELPSYLSDPTTPQTPSPRRPPTATPPQPGRRPAAAAAGAETRPGLRRAPAVGWAAYPAAAHGAARGALPPSQAVSATSTSTFGAPPAASYREKRRRASLGSVSVRFCVSPEPIPPSASPSPPPHTAATSSSPSRSAPVADPVVWVYDVVLDKDNDAPQTAHSQPAFFHPSSWLASPAAKDLPRPLPQRHDAPRLPGSPPPLTPPRYITIAATPTPPRTGPTAGRPAGRPLSPPMSLCCVPCFAGEPLSFAR